MKINSLPFKITNAAHGFGEAAGILRLEDDTLLVEFRIQDNMVGILKSEIKVVEVHFEDLEEVSFTKGIFGHSLKIRIPWMALSDQIPSEKPGEWTFRIVRKDAEIALDFVSSIRLVKADEQLRNAEVG